MAIDKGSTPGSLDSFCDCLRRQRRRQVKPLTSFAVFWAMHPPEFNCWSGFRIIVLYGRTRWDNSKPRLKRLVVIGN